MRRKDPDKLLRKVKAEEIAFEYGIYDVQDPTPDLPADFAEREWEKYEGMLPGAIRALDGGVFGPADWQSILMHIQAVWARHPDFARDMADQSTGRGEPCPVGDDVQRLRRQVLPEVRAVMAGSSRLRNATTPPRRRQIRGRRQGLRADRRRAWQSGGRVLRPVGLLAVLMALGAAQSSDDYEQGPTLNELSTLRAR